MSAVKREETDTFTDSNWKSAGGKALLLGSTRAASHALSSSPRILVFQIT